MTIDDIKRDREAGTPGPWSVAGDGKRVKPMPFDQWFHSIADTSPEVKWADGNWNNLGREVINARRIARVPELEALALAGAELADAVHQMQELGCQGSVARLNMALYVWEKLTNE